MSRSRLSSFLTPWMVVALFTTGYILITLSAKNWDPMAFVIIGGKFDPRVANDSYGYDGQFAYQIARDPVHAPQYLDVPAYRYQRILYPAAAYLLSFGGNEILLPWVLILINLLSLVGGTAVTEKILVRHEQSRWYALSYGLFVGLLLPVRLDLTEPLAFLMVQLGYLSFDRRQFWRASLFFALAALARELTLTFALAGALALFSQKTVRFSVIWGLVTILPFVLLQIFLKIWLGNWGIASGGAMSTPFELFPFRGWWSLAGEISFPLFLVMSLVVVPLALLPAAISIVVAIRRLFQRENHIGTWSLLINSLLFPFLPQSNVLSPLGLVRVTSGLVVAVLDYGAIARSKRALQYSLLWVIAIVFLYQDSLLGDL